MSSLRQRCLGWDLKHKEQSGNRGDMREYFQQKKQHMQKLQCEVKMPFKELNESQMFTQESREMRPESYTGTRSFKILWVMWRCLHSGEPLKTYKQESDMNRFYFLKYSLGNCRWLKWKNLLTMEMQDGVRLVREKQESRVTSRFQFGWLEGW